MKIEKALVPFLACAALAGCSLLPSVGPDYEEPDVEIPELPLPDAGAPATNTLAGGEFKIAGPGEDLRASITTNDVREWWAKFNDDILTGLLERSVTNNLSFLMAQDRLMQARWSLLGACAAFLPKVDASASAIRLERGRNTSSMWTSRKKLHQDVFSAGFDASWEIDIFGGARRATEAAWAEAEAAGWSFADAWVSLTAEVASDYVALRTVQSRIAVARKNLLLQKETYEILKSRLDSGIGDELAVNQSKYVMDQTHAAIPPLLAEETALKDALAILAGEMPGALDDLLSGVPDRDWLVRPAKLDDTPVDMIRSRPDVRVAERKLAAQVARVGVAKSMWYPKLYINGTLGFESVHPSKLFNRDSLTGSIGPSISWPIFRGGSIYANIKTEEAKMDEAVLAYELAVQKAAAEVRDAYSSYTQEYHRYAALQGAVKAAGDAVAISRDLYKNGLRDFTAVIDAQRSLLSLEESLAVSRGQITVRLIALYKALGGGVL